MRKFPSPPSEASFLTRSTVDRRAMLMGAAMAGSVAMMGSDAKAEQARTIRGRAPRFAYVGCRTTRERNARGEGIQVYRVNSTDGEWTHVQVLRDLVNPSFLALDRNQRFLFSVHGDGSDVSAFLIDQHNGQLTFLNRQTTKGRNPVHLTIDKSNRFLIVANYATGSLVVLPVNGDGTLESVKQLTELPGDVGPNRVEQTFSHPHEVAFDPTFESLIVPDKGLDRIFSFRFDADEGRLLFNEPSSIRIRPGAGPRHVVFHPTAPILFAAHELESSVATYGFDKEKHTLQALQIIPSVPDTFTEANTAAEIDIAPSGRFVYVSNRGHDSIGIFGVDEEKRRLAPVDWVSSKGKGPRFFNIDPSGSFLNAANENSDSIVTFKIDPETGRLSPTGQVVNTGSPVCIVYSTF
jgi:6-phosphogluconolactonase